VRHDVIEERDVPAASIQRSWLQVYRADLLWALGVAGLVAAAFVLPHLHLRTITPLVDSTAQAYKSLAQTAPILGQWMPHAGWGTPFALVIAIAVIGWGPILAQQLRWRQMTIVVWLASAGWALALALIDGWQGGFAGRLTTPNEYLTEVPRVAGLGGMLHGFSARILDYQPDSWNIQVAGHPAGALLTFVGLDRIGLGGGIWASTFTVLIGSSAAMAVVVTIRALAGESTTRRAAPFVVLAPTAIWIAVSADAYYAGVAAWGLAMLALAATGTTRFPFVAALGAGLLLGLGIYLDYGLVLMTIPALAVLVIARNYRPLIGATVGALVVVAAFTAFGFWWFEGYHLVQRRYWQGVAKDRPFSYWIWANLASLSSAVGLAAATALHRAFDVAALRSRRGLHVLLVAFVVVVATADLSGLSKAETERIWLPFAVWLVAAPALMPRRSHRACLIAQAGGALVINTLILTNW
jgi:hypothetical protein